MAANYLTNPAIGQIAKQPEFKYCAVRLAPAPDGAGARAGLRANDAAGQAAKGRRRRSVATPGAGNRLPG